LVPPLVLGALFSALGTFLGSAYQVKLRSGAMFFTSLAGAVCNLFFNFLLIPPLGAMGAAISTVASYFVIFLLRLLHTAKLLTLRRHVALWAPAVGYLSLAAVFLSKGEWLLALVPVLLVPFCFLPVLKEVKNLVFLLLFRQKTGQVIDKGEDVLYNK
jgi:O-antigen/teichoic acid export membrane protein